MFTASLPLAPALYLFDYALLHCSQRLSKSLVDSRDSASGGLSDDSQKKLGGQLKVMDETLCRFPQPGYEVRLLSTTGTTVLSAPIRPDDTLAEVSSRLRSLTGKGVYWWVRVACDTSLVRASGEAVGKSEALYRDSLDTSQCYVCPYVVGAGHASSLPANPVVGSWNMLLEQFDMSENVVYAASREYLLSHGVSDEDVAVYAPDQSSFTERVEGVDSVIRRIESMPLHEVSAAGYTNAAIVHGFAPEGSYLQTDGLEGVYHGLTSLSVLMAVLQRVDGTQSSRVSRLAVRTGKLSASEVDLYTTRMLSSSVGELLIIAESEGESVVRIKILPDLTSEISASIGTSESFDMVVSRAIAKCDLVEVLRRVFGVEGISGPGNNAMEVGLSRYSSRHIISVPRDFVGIGPSLDVMYPLITYTRVENNLYEVSLCKVPDFDQPSPVKRLIMRDQYLLTQGRSDEVVSRISRELGVSVQDVRIEIGNHLNILQDKSNKGRFLLQSDAVAYLRRQATGVVVNLSGMRSIKYVCRLLYALSSIGGMPNKEMSVASPVSSSSDSDDVQAVLARVHAMQSADSPVIENAPEHGAKYVLNRLYAFDRELFNMSKPGFSVYAKMCGAVDKRQPIALSSEQLAELRAEDVNAGRPLTEAVLSKKGHAYICPDVWCPTSQTSMTLSEYNKRGCTSGEKGIVQNDTTYWKGSDSRHPGFLRDDRHPTGLCMPCCFKRSQAALQSGRARLAKCGMGSDVVDGHDAPTYIMAAVQVPLPAGRRGEIRQESQLSQHSLLRMGVDQTNGVGFLSSIAYLHGTDVQSVRNRISSVITVPTILEVGKEGILNRFLDVSGAPGRGTDSFLRYLKSASGRDHLRATGTKLTRLSVEDPSFVHELVLWDAMMSMREYIQTQSVGHAIVLPFLRLAFPGVCTAVLESLDNEDVVHTPLGGTRIVESSIGVILKTGDFYEPLIFRGKRTNDALLFKVHPVASRIISAHAQAQKVYKGEVRELLTLLGALSALGVKVQTHVLSVRLECVGVLLTGGLYVPLHRPDTSSVRAPGYVYEHALVNEPIDTHVWNVKTAGELYSGLNIEYEVLKDAFRVRGKYVLLKHTPLTKFLLDDMDTTQFVKLPANLGELGSMNRDAMYRAYDAMRLHLKTHHLEEMYVLSHPLCPYPKDVRVARLLELTSSVTKSGFGKESAMMIAFREMRMHTEMEGSQDYIISTEDDVIDGTMLSAVLGASRSIDFFRVLRSTLVEDAPTFESEFQESPPIFDRHTTDLIGKLNLKTSVHKGINTIYTIGLVMQETGRSGKVSVSGYVSSVVSDSVRAVELHGNEGVDSLRLSSVVSNAVKDEFYRRRGGMARRLLSKFSDPRVFTVGPGDVARYISGPTIVAIVLHRDGPVAAGSGNKFVVLSLYDTRLSVAISDTGGVIFKLSDLSKPLQRWLKSRSR